MSSRHETVMRLPSSDEYRRVAVVGTSHVGCVRAAVDTDSPVADRWRNAFFFAVNAPMLSKQNARGWPESNGALSFDIPEAKAFLGRLFGNPDLRFLPAQFDIVILIDFFYCYDFSYQLIDNKPGPRKISGAPISEALFKEVLSHRIGRSWYGPASAVGAVPDNSITPLLAQMKRMAPQTRFVLAARPAQPVANKSARGLMLDETQMLSGMRIFENAARDRLAEIGIDFVTRADEQCCPETGLTPDRFSVGPHPSLASALDEHTNAEYGLLLLQQVESMMGKPRERL